ncbi:MAG TPA: hypothetical protein DDY31_03730 [Lachnospiraceae bacterium]|nr:hypothetical protein [Lachnospiraceae bacterium]
MLAENEAAFSTYRQDFLKVFQDMLKQEMEEGLKAELGQARDGSSVLLVEKDGKSYRLNSAFRPVQEAERWALQYDFDYLENIVVLFGLGNGIFARNLLKRLQEKDIFIIYEPSLQIFQLVLEKEDISDILADPRVRLVVEGINEGSFSFVLEKHLDWRTKDAFCVCMHPKYDELFTKQGIAVMKQVGECKELANVLMHTDVHLSHQTVLNVLFNVRYIEKANIVSDYVGKIPEGFPAIIVAAGPSLDKNIEQLKRAEGKAFIVAVDSAVKTLINHGISFDAYVSVDAMKSHRHTDFEECHFVPLLCTFMSNRGITSVHQGKKIWITGWRCLEAFYSELGHPLETVNLGGSVATAAFSACEKMGFQKIVLVGQDLAYDGKITHAGQTVKKIINEDIGQQEVDGWHGGKVRSRYDWLIYRNWFESAIQQLPKVQVIDATEGGALIHGSEVMTLSDVIDRYCTVSFSMGQLFEQTPPTFTKEEYTVMREKVRHMREETKTVCREAIEAVIVCDEVLNNIRQFGADVNITKQAKKLAGIGARIMSQNVYQLLDYYITDTAVEEMKEINRMTGSKEQDLLDTYNSARAMYQALIDTLTKEKIYFDGWLDI